MFEEKTNARQLKIRAGELVKPGIAHVRRAIATFIDGPSVICVQQSSDDRIPRTEFSLVFRAEVEATNNLSSWAVYQGNGAHLSGCVLRCVTWNKREIMPNQV